MEVEIKVRGWTTKEWTILNSSMRPPFSLPNRVLYPALPCTLFCPLHREAAIRFWMQEFMWLDKFCKEHLEFYRYHKSGLDHLDAAYFSAPDANDKTGGTVLRPGCWRWKITIPIVPMWKNNSSI
jgi:hypothetical protein